MNPSGEALSIAHYAEIAHRHDALLVVDSTFAPPPLQDPFAQYADFVMHSATKYFGGHSDLLAGVVATRSQSSVDALKNDRVCLGTIPSGHTSWLLLRSLRTFDMRVTRQSQSALILVSILESYSGKGKIERVTHSSIQAKKDSKDAQWINRQMSGGHSPTFAIVFTSESMARRFPSRLRLFHHATSLGGVESLVEWRAMSDRFTDRKLVRVSIGCENVHDLERDLRNALEEV